VKRAFTDVAWSQYCSWTDDRKTLQRINRMIDEALRDPGFGIGKPERLSGDLAGFWSRRIDQEHRLVYVVDAEGITVISARYHY